MNDLHVGIITGNKISESFICFYSKFIFQQHGFHPFFFFENFPITVSDRCSSGETEDKSGQVLRDLVTENFGASITSALVPDEIDRIEVRN